MARILIDDLPVADNLTPEQEELIFGAGLSFRPSLEHLEIREVLTGNPVTMPVLPSGRALVLQATHQMQIDYNAVFSNAAGSLAAQQVNVHNGVADITEAARATLESDILARLPRALGTFPMIGDVNLDRVTLNRLTLDSGGNFNGQLTLTYKYYMYGRQSSAAVTLNINNNQQSLDTDNAVVRQYGKLDQRQCEWQPQVTAVLDCLRLRLMPQFFGTQAVSTGGR
jgi:hypothetical protein